MINSKYCKSWLKRFGGALYMQQPKVKTREYSDPQTEVGEQV